MTLRYFLIVVFCNVLVKIAACGQVGLSIRAVTMALPPNEPILGEVVPIPACVTIDVDDDSRGFTTCAQAALRHVHVTVLRNSPSTTQTNLTQAFANLAGCSSSKTAMMIGHGDSGYIHVGKGDYFVDDDTKYVGDVQGYGSGVQPWNLPLWVNLSRSIKDKFNTIFLLGCETGVGSPGWAIVTKVATLTDSHVKAPTSKVWCDDNLNLRLEQGAKWTESGKDMPSSAANVQSYKQLSQDVKLAANEHGVYDTFNQGLIKIISRCVYNTPRHPVATKQDCRIVANQKRFLQPILFDQPFQPHAVPNAEVTGTIIITACPSRKNKPCQTRVFDVLNDDLVADTPNRTYYHVADDFKPNWIGFE